MIEVIVKYTPDDHIVERWTANNPAEAERIRSARQAEWDKEDSWCKRYKAIILPEQTGN